MLLGTSSSTSMLPRATSGSMMIARATEAASAVLLGGLTSRPKMKRPTMIEGRPFIRSRVRRIGPAKRLLENSVRKSAMRTPSGAAITVAMVTISIVPTSAGATPVGAPVKMKSRLIAPMPRATTV